MKTIFSRMIAQTLLCLFFSSVMGLFATPPPLEWPKPMIIPTTASSHLYCGAFPKRASAARAEAAINTKGMLYDRFGNYYLPEEMSTNNFGGGNSCSSGHFELDFALDFTTEEINTICQVFTDVSTLFSSQQSDIPIRIRKDSLGAGPYGAATAFYRSNNLNGGCGIETNLVWEHINSSIDFDNVLQSGYIAGELLVNTILPPGDAWHTLNIDDNGDFNNPGVDPNFIDLYSITLHEVMHMLGFSSQITADGSPLNSFYSSWDRQLFGDPNITNPPTTSLPLIVPVTTNPECCDAHEYNPGIGTAPSALMLDCSDPNQNSIAYQFGPAAMDVATVFGDYPSGAFPDANTEMINILSHLEQDCDQTTYVMHASFGDGEDRRVLASEELDILCNLGYDMIGGTPSTCTPSCNVVAIDDFFDSGFGGAATSPILVINYTDIISNDLADCLPIGMLTEEGMALENLSAYEFTGTYSPMLQWERDLYRLAKLRAIPDLQEIHQELFAFVSENIHTSLGQYQTLRSGI